MKAAALGDVIAYFNQQRPLNPGQREEWESFYIDTHRLDIHLIKNEFLRSAPGHKMLFGGHMGNGKSTELNKYAHDEKIQKRFTIIKFDIRDILNTNDLEVVELLITICFQILAFAEKNNISLSSYIRDQFKKLEGFFHDKLKIESSRQDSTLKDIGLKTEAGSGIKLPFLKLGAGFYARMRGQSDSRRMVREEYRPRLGELIDLVKSLLADLKSNLEGKEPFIIIDGLDRTSVGSAEKLFVDDGQNIALLDNATMLLTVPISIINSAKSPLVEANIGKIWVLKNLRLMTQNNKKDETAERNWNLMKQVILKRVESQLISRKALDMMVHYSGGVFTTLINLLVRAALEAETTGKSAIGKKEMERAVIEEKIKKSRPLGRGDWEILIEVDRHKGFISQIDEKKLELMSGLYILGYINDVEWYAVNPLLEDRLKERRKIFAEETGEKKKDGRCMGIYGEGLFRVGTAEKVDEVRKRI